jgi:hypothetical protein
MKSMQSSIERYLKEKNYSHSIIKDLEFFGSREAIKSRCKELKKKGKGNRPNRKRVRTLAETKQMWSTGALDAGSPKILQHTISWLVCTRFGLRANTKKHSLRWGDMKVSTNNAGMKYLPLNARSTKPRQGEDCANRNTSVKVFEDKDQKYSCPVALYEMYAKKRPRYILEADSKCYLQWFASNSTMMNDSVWYKRQICCLLYFLYFYILSVRWFI